MTGKGVWKGWDKPSILRDKLVPYLKSHLWLFVVLYPPDPPGCLEHPVTPAG